MFPYNPEIQQRKNYRIITGILERDINSTHLFDNTNILTELRAAGFDVSEIEECRNYIRNIVDASLNDSSDKKKYMYMYFYISIPVSYYTFLEVFISYHCTYLYITLHALLCSCEYL